MPEMVEIDSDNLLRQSVDSAVSKISEADGFWTAEKIGDTSVSETDPNKRNATWILPIKEKPGVYTLVSIDHDISTKSTGVLLEEVGGNDKQEPYIVQVEQGRIRPQNNRTERDRELEKRVIDTLLMGKKVPAEKLIHEIIPGIHSQTFDYEAYSEPVIIDSSFR